MNTQNLVLDINKKAFQTITGNVGEVASRFVRISIVDKSIPVDLTGVTVSLYAKKPDGNKVFNNVTIEDKTNGVVLAELTSQILAVEGLVKLTLLLVKNGGKLCSKQFLLNVDSCIVDDSAIESTNEFTALTDALGRVNNIDSRFENVSSQLEQNGIKIEKINKQLKLNVLDFGAVADGITDNTKVFQDIIDSIETFRIKTYFTPSTMTGKGAVIFIPSGKYLIKGSLKFKGGITFKGEGFTSVILHRPDFNSNLFESDYISNATWNNNILNVVWEDLSIEGDYNSLTDTGKSLVGINLNQCGLTRINRCFIGYFKTGIFNACNSNYEGGYYNVLTNSSVRACKLALDLNTDQYTVSDTNISPTATNIAVDYCVKACGGGISFSNCAIEGNVNKALYHIAGPGVSIQGGYSEANRGGSCFAEIDISKLQYGGVEINNLFTNPSIKFINLYNSTDFTTSYPMSTGIRINSKGDYINNIVKNGCFVDESDWGKNQASFFNGEVVNEGQMFSNTSYKMTKVNGTSSCSMRQGVKITTPNAFVTCVVKKSEDSVPFLAVFDSTNVLKNMVRLADYDNGWELYGVWIPAKSKDTTYTIALGLAGTSPVGSTIEFTNVGVYNNGIDYFPTN